MLLLRLVNIDTHLIYFCVPFLFFDQKIVRFFGRQKNESSDNMGFLEKNGCNPVTRYLLRPHTACSRLYGDCIWWKAYWTVLDEANANDLPPDLSEDVKYYTDINFKIDYAIVHGKHFGDQDIPEEFVSCIQLE